MLMSALVWSVWCGLVLSGLAGSTSHRTTAHHRNHITSHDNSRYASTRKHEIRQAIMGTSCHQAQDESSPCQVSGEWGNHKEIDERTHAMISFDILCSRRERDATVCGNDQNRSGIPTILREHRSGSLIGWFEIPYDQCLLQQL